MTRSYLFDHYTLDSQVSLSSCISIKTVLFFFQTFSWIITPISGIIDHYCIMEKYFKKSGENKNKLRLIQPKNHENFKNNKLIKKSVIKEMNAWKRKKCTRKTQIVNRTRPLNSSVFLVIKCTCLLSFLKKKEKKKETVLSFYLRVFSWFLLHAVM